MPEPTVEQRLYAEPFAFDFFQAVRLLQRLHPERGRPGHGGTPSGEALRFRALPSLSFPPSAVYELAPATADRPPLMDVTFLGLHGPSGVLPRHYTELILRLERERKGEERRALRDWLDLFNHRYVSLFHRAWEKYRFWVAYERGEHALPEPDVFTRALYSLVGLGTGGLRDRLQVRAVELGGERRRVLAAIDDRSLIYYGGLLMQRPRNAAGLRALLGDYFAAPVQVEQFVGQWLHLDEASRTRPGLAEGNALLGVNAVAGERTRDVQSRFRVRVGPLSYARFLDLLPDRAPVPEHKGFFLLCHLARLYAGPELDFEVQAVLAAAEVPECRLSEDAPGARLGWNTWLVSQQPIRDADQAVFAAEEVVEIHEGGLAV